MFGKVVYSTEEPKFSHMKNKMGVECKNGRIQRQSSRGEMSEPSQADVDRTHHQEVIQRILPLLCTNVHDSSVVEVPQKVHRGEPRCHGLNPEDRLVVHKPSPETVALCCDATLATRSEATQIDTTQSLDGSPQILQAPNAT